MADETHIPNNAYESALSQQPEKQAEEAPSRENQATLSGPSMRPQQRPTPRPNPKQGKEAELLAQRQRELTAKMRLSLRKRQNWVNKATMRRIQTALAKDPVLRNALFTSFKGGPTPFVMLDPKRQLQIVKNVSNQIKSMARNVIQTLAPDPNDVTNPYNQANPNNLANQQEAVQQDIILKQGNQVAALQQQEENQQEQQEQNSAVGAESQVAFALTLTAVEIQDISEHNEATFGITPRPEPGKSGKEPDDEEIKTAKKVLEDAGEEKSLLSAINGDHEGMIAGFKGASAKAGAEVAIEHAASVLAAGMGG